MDILHFLKNNQITYTLHEHPAAFSGDDVSKYFTDIPGVTCKNLFLRDKNEQRYFLLVIPIYKKADLKKFAKLAGVSKVTFASHESLKEKLDLGPGSVSPTGILFDQKKEVEFYIDREIYEAEKVNFHPNVNTASLELTRDMFHRFLRASGRSYQIIDL